MYRRTFEVIAKYVSSATGVKIAFDSPQGASADLQTNTLHLPFDITNENALSALALLMHEAGHIKLSKKIPIKKIVKNKTEFDILNAIEDVRVDQNNFGLLPNVREFYKELVKKHMDISKTQAPQEAKALVGGILQCEGFRPNLDQATRDILQNTPMINEMYQGTRNIWNDDWESVKNNIHAIKKILKIDDSKEPEIDWDKMEGDGEGLGGLSQEQAKALGQSILDKAGELMEASDVWGQGDGTKMQGASADGINPLALEEQTAQKLKDILNIKERKEIKDGKLLDTDSLVSYFTGDVEELFKDEKIVKNKKSRIHFLLDASGSMSVRLLDKKSRKKVTTKAVMKIIEILEEVRQTESLEVDWGIACFTGNYIPLTKENWASEYHRNSGGTNFRNAYREAIDELMSDYTIDGKRIIIAMSDGDVGNGEIEDIKHMISTYGADIRSLVIGVGTDINGWMAQHITGDNVILAEEHANDVIYHTLKTILEA